MGCKVVSASQQFRVRDCNKCTIYLHCKSQPVIESSHKLKFGCFQAYYPELRGARNLASDPSLPQISLPPSFHPSLSLSPFLPTSLSPFPDHFQAADLHPYHNQWSHIHNFTGQSGESDWSITQETTPPIDPPATGELSGCGLSFHKGQSTVPYSISPLARPTDVEVLALINLVHTL